MPDRIIRDEIGTSDTWLGLKRNTHRLGFLMMILSADDLGNLEATDGALWRIWRDSLALTDRSQIAEILTGIADAKLVRLYEVAGKRYAHIPKFRQRLRYVNGKHPRPPPSLECNEIKEVAEKSQTKVRPKTDLSQTEDGLKTAEVKRSEEKRSKPTEESPARVAASVQKLTNHFLIKNGSNPKTEQELETEKQRQLAALEELKRRMPQ